MKKSFILLVVFLITGCSQPKKEESNKESGTNELPPLMMTLMTGEKVMASSLPGNTILVFFSPDCDHCQREAQAIQGKLAAFKKYKLYFIAPSLPTGDIQQFAEKYLLNGYPNVLFAKADIPEVIRIFGPMSTPSFFIYSSEKRLVKKFDGETKVEEILKFL